MMEAIILAGGFGTRLRGVVSDLPKPMSPIGNTPFLSYLMDWLIDCGVTRFVLAVGYMCEKIESHYGNYYRDCPVVYSVEQEPLGTGGAIKQALGLALSPNVLVLNGDSILLSNFQWMMNEHISNGATLTVALKSSERFDRYGAVEHSNGIITRFREKAYTEKGEFNTGVYALNCAMLLNFMNTLEGKFSFEESVLSSPYLLRRCHCFDDYFIDIGIPEDYDRAQRELSERFSVRAPSVRHPR